MTGQRNRVSNFYQIGLGKIRKNLGKTEPENMEGVTERVNRNGEKVFELVSDYIAGKIIAVEMEAPEAGKEDFGSRVNVTLENAGVKAVLSFKWDSAYGRAFVFASPNINLSKEIEFEPYQYVQKNTERTKTGLSLIQDGAQLDWAFGTKANPGGCPQLEKITFKGKDAWDNSKQLKFLEEKFNEFAAKVKTLNDLVANEANAPEQPEADDDFEDF
ncbi:hypothetical protein [Maribacter dokdonensis]|nr:hypothetical protein [Maribacter dokdonensis]